MFGPRRRSRQTSGYLLPGCDAAKGAAQPTALIYPGLRTFQSSHLSSFSLQYSQMLHLVAIILEICLVSICTQKLPKVSSYCFYRKSWGGVFSWVISVETGQFFKILGKFLRYKRFSAFPLNLEFFFLPFFPPARFKISATKRTNTNQRPTNGQRLPLTPPPNKRHHPLGHGELLI